MLYPNTILVQRSVPRLNSRLTAGIFLSRSLVILTVLLLAFWILTGTASAQSVRSGWGSLPYHDSAGTGVTFRVWAPNASSVYVPGQFNNWSTTATPLAKEMTNGVWTGVWSADVAGAVAGEQYKYFINYSGGSVWHHDPRARLVTYSGATAGANDIIYDPSAFNWSGDSLKPPALNDLFVYELHIGTFDTNGGGSKFGVCDRKVTLGQAAILILR